MNIIPVFTCQSVPIAIVFYTEVLDFELVGDAPSNDPTYTILRREGSELHLSSHGWTKAARSSAAIVLAPDVTFLWKKFTVRGLRPQKPDSPVHQGVTLQTWGTREFYVEDPSGNTLIFMQR